MIDTDEKLLGLLARLRVATWVALDTEADSLHAYPEKACLVQISMAGSDDLVDPLARINLEPFWDALRGHELILHGADYDLRLLSKHHNFVPTALFDTMLAARLLGCIEFSLSILVERLLGVTLEKGAQTADWAQRPLTERMEKYAKNDTRHLKPLADVLRAELETKDRLAWHQETCARLIADSTQPPPPPDPDKVWRIKGSSRLDRRALAVLREVWQWREREAIAADRPPYFVLSHERAVDIAAAAANGRAVEPFIPTRFSDRRRRTLQQAITAGVATPQEKWPRIPVTKSRRPSQQEIRRFEDLKRRRDHHAHELQIDPTLIASRSTLAQLAEDWDRYQAGLMNWQRTLLGA